MNEGHKFIVQIIGTPKYMYRGRRKKEQYGDCGYIEKCHRRQGKDRS